METKNIVPGMIIVMRDNCRPYSKFTDKPSTHPYLVLSMNYDNPDLGYAQCMRITSMKTKKNMERELPILIGDSITFVVPYNIHSFPVKSVSMDSYKGFISPGFMSTGEFIELLMDIYKANICTPLTVFDQVARENISDRIMNYQVNFLEMYKDYPYYRDKFTESHEDINEVAEPETTEDTPSIGIQIVKQLEEPKVAAEEPVEIVSDHVDAIVEPFDKNGLTISSTDDGLYRIINCKGETVTKTRHKVRYLGSCDSVHFVLNCEDGTVITTDSKGYHRNWSGPYPQFVNDAIAEEKSNRLKGIKLAEEPTPEIIKMIKVLDKSPRSVRTFTDDQLAAAFRVLCNCNDSQISRYSDRWHGASAVKHFRINFYTFIKAKPIVMSFMSPSHKREFSVEIPSGNFRAVDNNSRKEIIMTENCLPAEVQNCISKCRELFPSK